MMRLKLIHVSKRGHRSSAVMGYTCTLPCPLRWRMSETFLCSVEIYTETALVSLLVISYSIQELLNLSQVQWHIFFGDLSHHWLTLWVVMSNRQLSFETYISIALSRNLHWNSTRFFVGDIIFNTGTIKFRSSTVTHLFWWSESSLVNVMSCNEQSSMKLRNVHFNCI